MAQWKETLEPYVKVVETVKTSALNPSAGGELIIGCVLISDAGPSVPTLITSQSEFLSTYTSADVTAKYIGSLDSLYGGADPTLASTMWMNAYRLAGSNSLLCVRASKATDILFAKPLSKVSNATYISRDGGLMKKVDECALVIDFDGDSASSSQSGWTLDVDGVGVFGNYVDDNGAQYEYYMDNLVDLVNELNNTTKFFSPKYYFAKPTIKTKEVEVEGGKKDTKLDKVEFERIYDLDVDSAAEKKKEAKAVIFEELYLGNGFAGQDNRYTFFTDAGGKVIDINDKKFEADKYYAVNSFNSATNLRVRIRRFNHDAVMQKTITDTASLTESSNSPWIVMKDVLATFINVTEEPVEGEDGEVDIKKNYVLKSETTRDRDFYEVAVFDPSISNETLFFNIGKIMGRGDMEVSEVNSNLKMIQLVLPDDMAELNLNYYGFKEDDDENTREQVFANLTIDPTESAILNVSDSDLKKALDLIALDEVYVTEGLCDLGNTELSFQNYMANMAINENYFYPISTVNSTNYMTIANNASKVAQESYKLYLSAPWDVDSGTMGWKAYMSPSVLYWEAVARNRRNNEEFRGVLGQSGGIVQYQKPLCEFNKKTRQLLLSKRINTVLWNIQTGAWNMNDNFTKQSVENIMSDDGNSRLAIRISKAMPLLLRQFIGRKITQSLWDDAKGVLNYWFNSTIMPMRYTIGEYMVIIDETNNPQELQKQNKMAVTVNVRYLNSLKYITVYHNILELGMDVSAV